MSESFDAQAKKYRELLSYQSELKNYLSSISLCEEEEIETSEVINEVKPKVNHLDVDVTYYMGVIKHSEDISEFYKVIPEKKSKDFKNIINKLLIELYREIVLLRELLTDTYDEELAAELHKYEEYSNELSDYRDYEEVENNEINTNNSLVFLMASESDSYLERDLKNVSPDQYADFLILLESIKNGTFKQVKRLTYAGRALSETFLEVKKNQARIFFEKLDKNVYLIIGCMIKKVNTSSIYKNYLRNRADVVYSLDFNEMKAWVKNADFMALEEKKEEALRETLKEVGDKYERANR